MSEYLGYNFAAPIYGNFIPQRLQNLCIRDYAQSKKLVLSFSVSEYADYSQSLMLLAQLDNLDKVEGFIFFSILLLPPDKERRETFLKRIKNSRKKVHFALEDLTFDPALGPSHDIIAIERIFQIGRDERLNKTSQELIRLGFHGAQNRN